MFQYKHYFDIYRQEFADHFLKSLLIFEESTSSPESNSEDGQIWPYQPQQVRPRLANILSQKTHADVESVLPATIGPFLLNQHSLPWRNYVTHNQHSRQHHAQPNSEYFTAHGMQMLCLVVEEVAEEICRIYEHQILSLATGAEVGKLAAYTVLRVFKYAIQHKQTIQLHRNDLLVAIASKHVTVSSDRTVQYLKTVLGVYDSMLHTRHGDSWLLKKIFSCPGVRVHKGAGEYDFYADMHADPANIGKYGFRHPIFLWQDHLDTVHILSHSTADTDIDSSTSISIRSSNNSSSSGVNIYTSYIPHPLLDHEKSTFQKVDFQSVRPSIPTIIT
ncbi:hypothetical protein EON65_58440 [archaeon]|nr:MAG: hypothetical protein EON65_58440 [archaeon]